MGTLAANFQCGARRIPYRGRSPRKLLKYLDRIQNSSSFRLGNYALSEGEAKEEVDNKAAIPKRILS